LADSWEVLRSGFFVVIYFFFLIRVNFPEDWVALFGIIKASEAIFILMHSLPGEMSFNALESIFMGFMANLFGYLFS
jgi:hypothetical protein